MVPPKDVHVLTPGTCEYAILHGKKYFVDVKKLRILRWRLPCIIWVAQIQSLLSLYERDMWVRVREDVKEES